jgi:hypothetical protein
VAQGNDRDDHDPGDEDDGDIKREPLTVGDVWRRLAGIVASDQARRIEEIERRWGSRPIQLVYGREVVR